MRTKTSTEITIVEVAKQANVSIATVSRVMNGTAKVSAKKKEAVYKAIEELGYIPNEAARSLPKTASRNITVIMPSRTDVFKTEILNGLLDISNMNDVTINLLAAQSLDDANEENFWFKIKQLRTAGVIVLDSNPSKRIDSIIEHLDIPLIFMNNTKNVNDQVYLIRLSLDSFALEVERICNEDNINEVQIVGSGEYDEQAIIDFSNKLTNSGIKVVESAKTVVVLNDQEVLESGLLQPDTFIISIEGTTPIANLPQKKAYNYDVTYQAGAFAGAIIQKFQDAKFDEETNFDVQQVTKIDSKLKRG